MAHLADEDIHDPSDRARPQGYPPRRIDHRQARELALAAWKDAKGRVHLLGD